MDNTLLCELSEVLRVDERCSLGGVLQYCATGPRFSKKRAELSCNSLPLLLFQLEVPETHALGILRYYRIWVGRLVERASG
eukprot:gene10921-biopygen15793